MRNQIKEGGKKMETDANKEMQEEMIGVLNAISIVSKRLAARLLKQNEKPTEKYKEKGEAIHE